MVVSMERWIGKVAIVTGASAGIGAAIAEALVDHGLMVVGLARRVERIEELSNKLQGKRGKLYAVKADLSKEDDILKAFEWTKNNVGPIHVLVNNAGCVALTTNLTEGDTELWKKVLDLNVLGLCIVTREAVKNMRENNIDGHIIHINSESGHNVPNFAPILNVYPASKFAVTALTETLRQELNSINSKIKITSISPGEVMTEIAVAGGMKERSLENLQNHSILNPEDVADATVYVLSTPPHVQVHELRIKPIGETF